MLLDFKPVLSDFWPFLEDLELFLRLDLGGKLGFCYPLQSYINHRFLEALEEVKNRKIMNNCKS
jgi:hypothetical protein